MGWAKPQQSSERRLGDFEMSEPQTKSSRPWIGMWKARRLVVFDPGIQPADPDFMLLYFVQGQSLCVRHRALDRKEVRTVNDPNACQFALGQYAAWTAMHVGSAQAKRNLVGYMVEQPGPIRRKCRACDGEAHWTYTVGTFSDGAHSDGQNVHELCKSCGGQGFVDNTIG